MEQYPDLQEDLSLEDTNESLNQLKLASLDDKNWPPDEVPVFPKSGDGFFFAADKSGGEGGLSTLEGAHIVQP